MCTVHLLTDAMPGVGWVDYSAHPPPMGTHIPHPQQNDWQTPVKTLPTVADGKKRERMIFDDAIHYILKT